MFEIASEWKLVVDEYRVNDKASISAIEPEVNFTSDIIGIFATSSLSPADWYFAGDFSQIYQVGFGASGSAQSESLKIILNRYQIYRFNKILFSKNNYLISFTPKFYLKDIKLQVWEYIGQADMFFSSSSRQQATNALPSTEITVTNTKIVIVPEKADGSRHSYLLVNGASTVYCKYLPIGGDSAAATFVVSSTSYDFVIAANEKVVDPNLVQNAVVGVTASSLLSSKIKVTEYIYS